MATTVSAIPKASVEEAMRQLEDSQRILDYETKEFTVELLVQKFGDGGEEQDIFVPAYQRNFNWDQRRQSRFIESLVVGLPIPFLFFADAENGQLEVVDGRQRLGTCRAFLNGTLVLSGLERLDLLNGYTFADLSRAQQRRLVNRTIRSVVISQKAREEDRRDLFDRINTGSLIAEPAETRRGSFAGPMTDLIDSLAADSRFETLCPIPDADKKTREAEELLTRFFAFGDGLGEGYRDRIGDFLKLWLQAANERARKDPTVLESYRARFTAVMDFVSANFPMGFRKTPAARTTPRVRFDALAVGAHLALLEDPTVASGPRTPIAEWLDSEAFFLLTTSSAANVRSRILNRTEYVKFMILGQPDAANARAPEP